LLRIGLLNFPEKIYMRLILKLFLCLCLAPLGVFCQERVTQTMAGPSGDESRIVVSFMEPAGDAYKLQSLIIIASKIKNNTEQPKSVFVDLTSTVRTLSTGAKKQKILQLRWDKSGEVEFKCEDKWKKQAADMATGKIVEAVKSLFGIFPADAKTPTPITLSNELEQKILAIMDSLKIENFACLRELK